MVEKQGGAAGEYEKEKNLGKIVKHEAYNYEVSLKTHQHYGILLKEQIMAQLLALHRQLSSRHITVNGFEGIW